jgi:hypothetical protein
MNVYVKQRKTNKKQSYKWMTKIGQLLKICPFKFKICLDFNLVLSLFVFELAVQILKLLTRKKMLNSHKSKYAGESYHNTLSSRLRYMTE